ncbi:MAG: hemerythrin domain-containing protein [Ottowia sp.]|jgi:hemerythrin-like domain-containing protein|nr:hemerythrin domain-containing protein [Ottowia sp.]MBK6746691.1 hemerythrin domain-containing protein [Ottowia sp.]
MRRMSKVSASIPGFSAPAVGFEQPFEMLEACHDRVRRSLALLRRIVDHVDAHGHDAASRSAVADVLRYFDLAGPHHHEDEERHVFPPLQAHADARLREAVARLRADHVRMNALWARLRQALLAWQGDAPPPIGAGERALVDAFVAAYESHMALEESVAYPAARPLFGDGELQRIGDEMASRRRQDTRR